MPQAIHIDKRANRSVLQGGVIDNPELETMCPLDGCRFVRLGDQSTVIEGWPRMLYPIEATCEQGHAFEVGSVDVTKTGTALTLSKRIA